MKKSVLLLAFIMMTAMAFSKSKSRNSNELQLGGSVGTMYGVDFKLKHGNLAFIADLGVNFFTSPLGFTYIPDLVFSLDGGYNLDAFTFELNPNLVYQNNITNKGNAALDWYIGGGISGGMIKALKFGYDGIMENVANDKDYIYGKFGLNFIAGIDVNFNKVPLVMSFDFRPGYGLGIKHESEDEEYYDEWEPSEYTAFGHYFDWKLVLGFRYRF